MKMAKLFVSAHSYCLSTVSMKEKRNVGDLKLLLKNVKFVLALIQSKVK
jgi:hypothetical protein